MKFLVTLTSSILIAATVLSLVPCLGEAEVYNNTLRLHLIAESDSDADQALKLKVRDAVLECTSAKVSSCSSFEEAYGVISLMTDEIEAAAEKCIKENGCAASVRVELGLEKYPRRVYGECTIPAGEYNSLRVIIGEGEGKNWWCVLFPSVCMGFARDKSEYAAVGFTPQEYRVITKNSGSWKIRFKILEVLSDIVGFEYP